MTCRLTLSHTGFSGPSPTAEAWEPGCELLFVFVCQYG